MSMVKNWKVAKAKYDAVVKQAQKDLKPVQEKFEAAEYMSEQIKKGKFDSGKFAKKYKKFANELTIHTISKDLDKVARERADLVIIEKRPLTGLEPALSEVENVLAVGEKLVAAGVTDAAKWEKYQKLYDGKAKQVMKGREKLLKFAQARGYQPERKQIEKDLNAILKEHVVRSRTVYAYFEQNVKNAA